MDAIFPKKNRLLASKQFQFVFKNPRKFFSKSFLILSVCNNLSYSRIGIAIKKKNIKHSVKRNTQKRVIRESFRKNSDIVLAGLDMVIIVHNFLSKKQLTEHLDYQWKRIIGFYNKF